MNRVSCPRCGKQFRKGSGLAYHLDWAHKSAGTGSPHKPDVEDEDKDFLQGLFGNEFPSPEEQAKMLEQIQQQLGRLQGHEHEAVEGDCATCYEMLHEIGQRGMLAGAKTVFSIPGILEANAYYNRATAQNAKGPSSSQVVTSWIEVPGIQELLEHYYREDEMIRALEAPVTLKAKI